MFYAYVSFLPRDKSDNEEHGITKETEMMPIGFTSVDGDLTLLRGKELSLPKITR
jgi:hypothetical protein